MPKFTVKAQVTIKAAPAVVFDYLTDPSTHALWNTGLHSVTATERLHEGMTYQSTSVVMGLTVTARNQVVRLIPDRELVLNDKRSALNYEVNFLLNPEPGEQTNLIMTLTVSGEISLFVLAVPVLEYVAHARVESDLQTLKLLVENKVK